MNEYRCTRNSPYSNPKCFGHTDLEARQGYYFKAESEDETLVMMSKQFPGETEAGFTVHLWKIDCPVCCAKGIDRNNKVICNLCYGAKRVEVSLIQM